MDDYQVDFALEKIDTENDQFKFIAKSITKDFVCEPGLDRLAKDSPGKHLIWRHEHPIIPKYNSTHIYGRVLESKVDEGAIISTYEVYGHTPEHLKARRDIEKRFEAKEPISISMRYRQYGEKDPIHFDVVEHSLTPTPACKECVALDILNESDNMTKTQEDLMKEIKELEDELTKKDKLYEELESKVVVIEKKLEESIKDIESKETEIETEKSDKDKILEKILELNDKLGKQNTVMDKLQEDIAMKDVEPLINSLVELDGKEMNDIYWMKAKQSYKEGKEAFDEALEFFKKRVSEKESAVHALTTDLDSTAKDAQIKDEELEDEAMKKKRDDRAFANMPKEFFEKKDGE